MNKVLSVIRSLFHSATLFLKQQVQDQARLHTLAQAVYCTAPWWQKTLLYVVFGAWVIEMLLWFTVFGPVSAVGYAVILLLGIYLWGYTLVHTRYLPSIMATAGVAIRYSKFDKAWGDRCVTDGLMSGVITTLITEILGVAGLVGGWSLCLTILGMLLVCFLAFGNSARLLCWLYCSREQVAWIEMGD